MNNVCKRFPNGRREEERLRASKMAKRYETVSSRARLARQFINILLFLVPVAAVIGAAVYLGSQPGVSLGIAVGACMLLGVILALPYRPSSPSFPLRVRVVLFFAVALVAQLIKNGSTFLGIPPFARFPILEISSFAKENLVAVVNATLAIAVGALCATVMTALLRRCWRDVGGSFRLSMSKRDEVVCELVQAAALMTRAEADPVRDLYRPRVVAEKVDRIRHLFREPWLKEAKDGNWGGCRDAVRRFKRIRDCVRQYGSWSSDDEEFLVWAAELAFCRKEGEMRDELARDKRKRRQGSMVVLRHLIGGLVGVALWVGAYLGLRVLHVEPGQFLEDLMSVTIALFIATVVLAIAPDFLGWAQPIIRALRDWLKGISGSRGRQDGDKDTDREGDGDERQDSE